MKYAILSFFLLINTNLVFSWLGDFAKFPTLWPMKDSWGKEWRSIVDDPTGTGTKCLKVIYPKDSYANGVLKGGSGFYVYPINGSITNASFEYEVYFPTNFDWVKGGKLPGIFGGRQSCSGGDSAEDCFSARFMWGKNGNGYPYLYLPKSASHLTEFCSYTGDVTCSQSMGFPFNETAYFTKNQWYKIKEYIELNTPGKPDGVLKVWVNGERKVNYNKIIWRKYDSVKISGIIFSTFFGGSTESWKTPVETYTLYKNFKYYI